MKKLLPLASALDRIAEITPTSLIDTIDVANAAGRVLATDTHLPHDIPAFDRSAMDGYAVMGQHTRYDVIGTCYAGERWLGELVDGQAIRIMTGAPAPAGTAVVPREHTDDGQDTMHIADDVAPPVAGAHIAQQGEDARAGDICQPAGTRLTAAAIATLAMARQPSVQVYRPPRICIITSGNETASSGDASVADSNGPLLRAMLHPHTGLAHSLEQQHCRDHLDQLVGAAETTEAEIIISTGGVSVGDADLVPAAAAAAGFVTSFHHLALQPGKPVFLAHHPDGRCWLGLPGNPVSVLATATCCALPLIGRWLGGWLPPQRQLPLAEKFHNHKSLTRLLPAKINRQGTLELIRLNGSGDLLAASQGEVLAMIPPQCEIPAGGLVAIYAYPQHP